MDFYFVPDDAGGILTCSERKLVLRRQMSFSEWPESGLKKLLRRFSAGGDARETDSGLHLSTAALLEIPESIASSIRLPGVTSLSMTVSLKGRIETPDGELRIEWRDPNFRVIVPQHKSLFVVVDGKSQRLTGSVFELWKAIQGYNQTRGQAGDERIASWLIVQNALERAVGESVKAEQLLKSFHILQAGAFALDVRESPNGPTFSPVLMGPELRPSLSDDSAAPEDGENPRQDDAVSDQEALLLPEQRNEFVKAFDSHVGGTRKSYVIGKNAYVLIPNDLQRALDVVRRASNMSSEERRAFVRNPRSLLSEELPELGEKAGSLFVETQSYSERVVGLGLWEKPSLPWLQRGGTGWLPENVSLEVGEKALEIRRDDLPELNEKVTVAEGKGSETLEWHSDSYQTRDVRRALTELGIEPRSQSSINDPKASASEREIEDSNVLQIRSNLEEVEYVEGRRRQPKAIVAEFPSAEIPVTKPKPHQEKGFRWLAECWAAGRPGVLLADDMGLGKTLQTLAFLIWVKPLLKVKGPILIVAPTALLRNWQAEAETHLSPGALGHCVEVFGKNLSNLRRSKGPGWTPEDALDTDRLRSADWILTTYETLANYHRAFARLAYPVVVFDEMQKIKAPDTINSHAAKTLNADFVLGLTGTPIENRIEDLWCIMDRIESGYLGSLRAFSKAYGGGDVSKLKELKSTLESGSPSTPSILLRRMKEDHLPGLPSRKIIPYPAEMPREQAAKYEEIVASAPAVAGTKGEMLKIIHALRGVSLHPGRGLKVDPYDAGDRSRWIEASARVSSTLRILRDVKALDEKALVFIEDRAVQSVFAAVAAQEFDLEEEPSIINGATDGHERQKVVDRFQKDRRGFGLLVLSPKAAGVGLTITAANHVVHLSRWWNPAVEDQCNDRVYRIGQTKPVTVHIPQAIHPRFGDASFDKKLDQLLEKKRILSRDMLAPPVSDGDIEALFNSTISK